MARQISQAPPLQVPRYGLLAVAPVIDDGVNWEAGVKYSPEGCGTGGAVQMDCVPGEGELGDPPTAEDEVGFDAFEIWTADRCSALQGGRDQAGRARRAIDAARSFQIGAELWAGAITQARHAGDGPEDDGPSPYLTDGDATSVGSAVGMLAIAKADAEFARCSLGRRAMVHLTPYALAVAMDGGSGYVYRDGNMLLTQLGSIVVPEAGYGSSATDLAVHVSPIVSLRLGAVRPTPRDDTPQELQAALDRATNSFTAYAQQSVLYQFDADCCRKSATMTTS